MRETRSSPASRSFACSSRTWLWYSPRMVRKIDIKTKTMTIKYSIRKITFSKLDDIIITPSRSKSPKMLRIIAMNDSSSVAYSLMYGPRRM